MIQIRDVSKKFGGYQVLSNIDLKIEKGELIALLGPSGCGKTTLLRIIAGLESLNEGSIILNNINITGLSPQQRKIGFVFQHFALFKHMSVAENIAFGLTVQPKKVRLSKSAIDAKVNDLLKLIQMEWLADAYPGKLSGGQRQRVALARALAIEPSVLLLDEPFSSLDATVRRDLRRWLKNLHQKMHITSIFVTHDQEEALEIADRVVVMNNGVIEQIGTPEQIYEHPANRFVYQFLGDVNIFRGKVDNGRFDFSGNSLNSPKHESVLNSRAIGYIRPDEIELSKNAGFNLIPAKVVSVRSSGSRIRVELKRNDDGESVFAEIKKNLYRSLDINCNDQVFINIADMKVFLDEGVNI
ncbi:MAG TPA: sulfate/molybdate ABC transporter ATP-binding protein [Chitinispirillaceae bacterium]|nr:sulfate/molybdate ABC transporter ATP-binding protein [Chitinispirillaceae bacterium]